MSGKMSRDKGKRGERELAKYLREQGWPEARRTAQYCGSAGDADLADAIPNVHIEAKRTEKLSLYQAMQQASDDALDGEIPTVFHRRNRKDWLVVVRLDDLPAFAERVVETRKEMK